MTGHEEGVPSRPLLPPPGTPTLHLLLSGFCFFPRNVSGRLPHPEWPWDFAQCLLGIMSGSRESCQSRNEKNSPHPRTLPQEPWNAAWL